MAKFSDVGFSPATIDAMQALLGFSVVGTGSISDQQYFDISIPATGKMFLLFMAGVRFSDTGFLCGVLSYSGTFVNDLAHGDSYIIGHEMMDISHNNVPSAGMWNGMLLINPGTGANPDVGRILSLSSIINPAASGSAQIVNDAVRSNATTPPPASRPTALRILPYGNGDANPPTSGYTMSIDQWALLAVG